MKRLSGEKTGSKIGLLKNSFILFFLILSNLTFSQIPINGFCYRNDFLLPKDYVGIISADLNFNNNNEIILYSPSLKHIGIYSGTLNGSAVFNELPIKSEISQLKKIKNKEGYNNLFAAVERKQRKVSFFSIYLDSLSEKLTDISFDSYPENIINVDIDLNGNDEVLVCGSAFDGLSVLFRADGGIGERKIAAGTSFSEAVFIDINDDGFPDIAAFDIFDNSLRLFTNNTRGIFREVRTIPFKAKVNSLASYDLNNDGLPDLIYSIGKQIEILFGDFQSAFKKKIFLKIEGEPSSIQSGDFNGDKIPDLAYLISGSTVSIIFGKNGLEFFEPIPYLKNSSLASFVRFKYGSSNNLACLMESGELMVISLSNASVPDMKISLGIDAGAVKKFDYGNDGIHDIAFVDEFDNSLKLLVNNISGIPVKFYSIPLAEDHNEIKVDEFFSFRKIFYCYSNRSPLLEIFRYNFNTDRINRKQLYAPGELLDVSFQRIDSSFVNIYVLYNKNKKMYLGKFENRDVSITFREYPFIDRNVSSAKLYILNEPVVYYWKSEADKLEFNSGHIKSGPNELATHLTVPVTKETSINMYGADKFDNEYPFLVSIVQSESENYLAVVSDDKISVSKQFNNLEENKKTEFGNGFFGETSIKGIINFTVNSLNDGYINKLIYQQNENSYSLSKMFAAKSVSDYFIARLDKKNYFLIYSNKEESCISIRSLKK